MGKIMPFTKQVLKNLFSKPATTSYPAVPREYPERTRGHVEIRIEECILCGMCMRSCPPGAIEVKKAENTWTINRFDCVQCGYCVEKCPKKCLSLVPGYQEPGPKKERCEVVKPIDPEEEARKEAAKKAALEKALAMKAAKEAEGATAKTETTATGTETADNATEAVENKAE
ncbi:MAG: 4Fe-4S dicluster domain-containing protein [Lachnospiraceae bacterium]|nr:4Fe-4S dicluster domain-containing protein [Lachnospiraceae bacterium]